jgi:hypothetical protein
MRSQSNQKEEHGPSQRLKLMPEWYATSDSLLQRKIDREYWSLLNNRCAFIGMIIGLHSGQGMLKRRTRNQLLGRKESE